jgi:hypothetical protein
MFEPGSIGRQRFQALINGVVIGVGIGSVLIGSLPGVLLIVVGVGMEYWHRRRMKR